MARQPKVSREVVLLGWVSFFNDVSSEMIYPLVPMFLVVVLGATATSIGWVEGFAQAVVALLSAWAGWHSDRLRRRVPYVRIGYGFPVIGKVILAFAVAWPMVLVGRAVDRVGNGLRSSPSDALIADATTPETRGRAFGFHRMMDSAGAVLGVVLSALLVGFLSLDGEAPFRVIFGISAVLGLAAVGFTFLLREPTSAPVAAGITHASTAFSTRYWSVLAVLLVFSLANSSDTFLLLRAQQVGLPPWAVVLAYAVFSLVYMVVSYPAGILSDRVGRWPLLIAGWLLYAGVYAVFGLVGATGIWPLLAIYGVYMALTDGVAKALLADVAPRDRRGLALGIYYMGIAVTTLISSVVTGMLWDQAGAAAALQLGSILTLGALVLTFVIRPWRTSP
ncbi:MAG: MFS transporter [Kofleriaceae bacterium]